MKTMKLGVLLLAFLLAAMVMVPMVNAAEKNATIASTVDVSKIQLPQLQFNNSQTQVIVKGELHPEPNTQSAQITALVATKSFDISKIPYGSIIYHSKSGVTTVFDSTGKQLFASKDANATLINTLNGPAPATYIQEVPDNSEIVDTGKIIYVFYDKTLIMTVINENTENSSSVGKAAASSYPSQYIEGAETAVLPTVGQFSATWNVPKSPAKVNTYNGLDIYSGSQITIWNGVFGWVGSDVDSRLLQPVLEWYKKDTASDPTPDAAWTMATWYVTGKTKYDYIHSTRRTLVYSGDTVRGNIQLNTLGYDAIASITDLGPDGGGSSTLFLTKTTLPKRMPNTNVQATVVLEGWDPTRLPGLSSDYLCGSVNFGNFVLKDSNGNTISTSMNGFINSNYWGSGTFGLNVANSWPSKIGLYTKNN